VALLACDECSEEHEVDCDQDLYHMLEEPNAALERLAHATTNKARSWRVRSKRLLAAGLILGHFFVKARHAKITNTDTGITF
jgi:hypothetical protein